MATNDELERAGKRLLFGLHRAGQTFAHGGGSLIDAMSGGQLNAAKAIDQFTDGVGLAYAEVGALPIDSPEARYIEVVRRAEESQAKQAQARTTTTDDARLEESRRVLAQLGQAPPASPQRAETAELVEGRNLLRQLGR